MDTKELATKLLLWHGGGDSALYAVGSTFVAGKNPDLYYIEKAANELRSLKRNANFPEDVSEAAVAQAEELEKMLPVKSNKHLCFAGQFELLERGDEVVKAKHVDPIMTDGNRCGRFECYFTAFAMFEPTIVRGCIQY